jgi:hypothetical protein
MSQRLHIGVTDSGLYEAIVATEQDATPENLLEWLRGAPHKIRIADIALWRKVQPAIADAFWGCFPDDVAGFFIGDERLSCPTQEELDAWVDEMEKKSVL